MGYAEKKLFEEAIWIIDTSSLIEIKSFHNSKTIFVELEKLVKQGKLGFPSQVLEELARRVDPDEPAIWARKMSKEYLGKWYEPDGIYTDEVLSKVGGVLDRTKKKVEADQFILAIALQLKRKEYTVTVVTEERSDKVKMSMKTASKILGLNVCNINDFLRQLGIL